MGKRQLSVSLAGLALVLVAVACSPARLTAPPAVTVTSRPPHCRRRPRGAPRDGAQRRGDGRRLTGQSPGRGPDGGGRPQRAGLLVHKYYVRDLGMVRDVSVGGPLEELKLQSV
jgi:hypothetical protein